MPTKSDQIRALAAEGLPVAEIARRLGIRYQHAYNVLKRRGAVGTSPKPRKSEAGAKPPLTASQLRQGGFVQSGRWIKQANSDLILNGEIPRDPGVYAFVSGKNALYVGVANMGLAKRLYFYARPGSTQRTSIRIKKKLLELLATVPHVDIYTINPPDLVWNGMTIGGAAGLEHGLIKTHALPWNIRGA